MEVDVALGVVVEDFILVVVLGRGKYVEAETLHFFGDHWTAECVDFLDFRVVLFEILGSDVGCRENVLNVCLETTDFHQFVGKILSS